MSLKKAVAIAAAAGALAAISVPAMALENEFHGSYTFNGIFSNFQDGGSGDFNPAFRGQAATAYSVDPVTGVVTPGKPALPPYGKHRQMNNYFEQRGRIQYLAKVSDDLKLVTQFELDTRFGGINDGKYSGTSDSGVFEADGISLETKHVYLDFNLGSSFNVKTGIMPYKDSLKGIFIDADVPAVYTTTSLGAYNLGLGFSRFSENDQKTNTTTRLGDRAKDLFIMDNTFAINKDTKAALSYYFLSDYQTPEAELYLHTIGASAETKLGALTLSGFAAMQAGELRGLPAVGQSVYTHGYAANVAAKAAVGPGTFKTAFLFVSGNNNSGDAQSRGWIATPASSYNESGMQILIRNTANSPTSTDRYLRRNITNIALATLGYDANLTDKVFLNTNIGMAWAPASQNQFTLNNSNVPVVYNTNPEGNSGDLLGTEFNLEAGYKVNSNLTLRAQAAYAILGPYYKNATYFGNGVGSVKADPENPYTMRLLASFRF